MIRGVFGRESRLASDTKENRIGRNKEKRPHLGRCRGKNERTSQLYSIIASQGMAEDQRHRLFDDAGVEGSMGEAASIILAKGCSNPITRGKVQLPETFLASDSGQDLGTREGRDKGFGDLASQDLPDPLAPGFMDVRLDQRTGVKEISRQLPLPSLFDDNF